MSKETFGGVVVNTIFDHPAVREAHQHEEKRYAAFEQAITTWEQRTGLFVERTHKVGEVFTDIDGKTVTTNYGKQWRNFSKFLGSREAIQYREENAMRLEDMLKEFMQLGMNEPDMAIKDPTSHEQD